MSDLHEAHAVIRRYSKTWYDPIVSMPPRLNEATSCAYLCMRGIDEIEDHPRLDASTKAQLLRRVGHTWQTRFTDADFDAALEPGGLVLPDVSMRLGEWSRLAPADIAPRVLETFAVMAERMADWVERGWRIQTRRDLDEYTYAVAGTLVLLLSDLWSWFDHTDTNRTHAIGYGRALQTANILIDRVDDRERGVDFWPNGWRIPEMRAYVEGELVLGDAYVAMLPAGGPARAFCEQPLERARDAVARLDEPIIEARPSA